MVVLAGLLATGAGVVGFTMVEAGSFDDHEPSPSQDGVVVREVPDSEKDLDEYWTEERMRNAEPL